MKTPDDASKMSNSRYDFIIQEQLNASPKKVWPLADEEALTLPQDAGSAINPK